MRRWLSAVLGVALACAVVLLVATPSSASARLLVSNPAAHEELSQQPGWVSLAFNGRVKRSMLKVLVVDASGRNAVVGDLIYQGSAVMVQLEDGLPQGTYTVKYQVNRNDGQPEGGAFQFAYGKGQWTDVQSSWSGTAQQPPEMANPDPMATGPVQTPSVTPPVVEVSDAPTPSDSPSDSPSATQNPSETPSESPKAVPSQSGNPALGWWIGGGLVVIAVGGGGWWWLSRRRGSGDADR